MAYAKSHIIHLAAEKIAGKCPCKGCTDRTIGCAGHCERFRDWKIRFEEAKKPLLEKNKAENDAIAFLDENYRKAVKEHRATEPKWRYSKKRGR